MYKQRIIAGLLENVNITAATGMHGRRRKENEQT